MGHVRVVEPGVDPTDGAVVTFAGRSTVALLALLALGVASCTDERDDAESTTTTSAAPPTTTFGMAPSSAVAADGASPFVDVTDAAGLALSASSVAESGERCDDGARLRADFPELVEEGGDSLDVDICQNERMAAGVAVGDVNGDGLDDIYVARVDEPGRLFVATARLQYADRTAELGVDVIDEPSAGAVFADIDDDGDLDLFVSTMSSTRFRLLVNDGTGHFVDESERRGVAFDDDSPHMGMSVAVGDVDRDGDVDLFTTEWRSPFVAPDRPYHARLLVNRGPERPGEFEDGTADAGLDLELPANPAWSMGAQFVDLDGDGWQDLAVTSDYGTSRLFWNDGDGTFTDGTSEAGVGTDENGMGSVVVDVDGDGLLDWFVTGIYSDVDFCSNPGCGFGRSGNRLYLNNGDRTFRDATDDAGIRDAGWAWGAAFVDVANSGTLDLIAASGYEFFLFEEFVTFADQPTRFWRGDGAGRFVPSGDGGITTRDGKGVAVFDADRDGRLDVLVARPGARAELFHNQSPGAGHYLRVEARGTTSNHFGLGAVVTVRVTPDGPTIRREIGSATGYLGWSEPTVHVGLGADVDVVAEVTVEFPASGREVVRRDVPVDQLLTVVEDD